MALEDILQAMEDQARAESGRIKAQAEAEAARIVAEAAQEAESIKSRQLARVMPKLQNERARLLNAAKLAALSEMLAARETLLEEAFAAATAQLSRVRENSEYPRYLAGLLKEVVDELGNELRIIVDARDVALMRRLVDEAGAQAEISTGLDTSGGLEASMPDGRIRVVNTVEARLERSKRYLRGEIADWLSGEQNLWKPIITTVTPASGQ